MANLFRCAGGGEDIKCIERPYDISKTYNAGDTVLYNGLLRICIANGVTGDFNESKWEVTTLEELLGENAGESATFVDYIASEYDPTHTYAAGDAILGDNGEILKCLEDEVTGEFDNSKWNRDYLCNLSGNVNSNLNNIIDIVTIELYRYNKTGRNLYGIQSPLSLNNNVILTLSNKTTQDSETVYRSFQFDKNVQVDIYIENIHRNTTATNSELYLTLNDETVSLRYTSGIEKMVENFDVSANTDVYLGYNSTNGTQHYKMMFIIKKVS